MSLSSNESAFTLYMFQDDVAKLRSLCPATYDSATEGSLYGLWTSTLNPVVHVVSNRRQAVESLESTVRKGLAARYKMSYLGEWRLVERSRELVSPPSEFQPGAPGFLSVHVAHDKIIPYMYERPTDRNPKKGSVEILPGDNPFSSDSDTSSIVEGRIRNRSQWQERQMLTGTEAYERNRSQQARHNYSPPQSRRPAAGEPATTKSTQWYSSEGGEENLKRVFDRLKEIAQQEQVQMSRDTKTQDMTISFESHTGKDCSVAFPSRFPRIGAVLKGKDRSGVPFVHRGSSASTVQEAMGDICRAVRY